MDFCVTVTTGHNEEGTVLIRLVVDIINNHDNNVSNGTKEKELPVIQSTSG